MVPQTQVHAIDTDHPALAALVEPLSIAVRAVARARIEAGEKVVVLGAGPIGQCLAVAALDRGAEVLLVDPVASRLDIGQRDRRAAAAVDDARRGPGPRRATGPATTARPSSSTRPAPPRPSRRRSRWSR